LSAIAKIVCPTASAPSGTAGIGSIQRRKHFMQWQTPKLVEIACGCEINAYFPADL
jgi:coenzyme PQQ precursor peptide PqqA